MSNMDHSKMNHEEMVHTTMNHAEMGHGPSVDSGAMQMDAASMTHMSMMKMYFHFSENSEILFEFWKTSSLLGILGSCVLIFIIAMLYEGLKVLREVMLHNFQKNNNYKSAERLSPQCTQESGQVYVIDANEDSNGILTFRKSMFNTHHLLQTCMHMLQITISYALMLIFMTYNISLCIAVVLGAGVGYFLFGWKRMMIIDANEHCH